MLKIKLGFLIVLLFLIQTRVSAQNTSNSPYTRYGYGQLGNDALGVQRAMGGVGYGIRNPKIINVLNPASFSKVDSMTFMLDVGITGQLGWFKDPQTNSKSRKTNGRLDYVAMQFPVYKSLGVGLGLKPVSTVGYSYGDQTALNEGGVYSQRSYSGEGGLNQAYGVLSYELFNRLSLGANVAYLFGDIRHFRSVEFINAPEAYISSLKDTMRISGLTYEFGMQYTHPIGKDRKIIVGGVFAPKIALSGKVMKSEIKQTTAGTIIDREYENRSYDFDMPQYYGIGVSYSQENKLMIGADYLYQQWSDAAFMGKTDSLKNRTKIAVGGEFIPDIRSRNYLSRVRYRLGGHYSDSYIQVQNSGYREYGVGLGFGLPLPGDRSSLNISFDYSMIKPKVSTLIDERYFKLTVSYIFNELWFHKRKVQ
jgi:Outer membrane protein transport protein (OMPP1/FadL/TodX).